MDLKIKDVAELLKVSETTIRRWLVDGKIPAYRMNHQYRFSLIEIENWMMSCKLKQPDDEFPFAQEHGNEPQRGGMQNFSLYRAIHKGGILNEVSGETKEELIRGTMIQVAPRLGLDVDVITELLLDREKMMPTALNHGIAVPHTREFVLKGAMDMVVVVSPTSPIEWGALDGNPVHTLFFLFSTEDKRHLHLLAKIAHLSTNPEAMELLKSHPQPNQLLEFIRDWEARLN